MYQYIRYSLCENPYSNYKTLPASILILSDNQLSAKVMGVQLQSFHSKIDIVCHLTAGLHFINTKIYDLIIIDVGLFDFPEYQLAKTIRTLNDPIKSQTPIFILCNHIDETYKRRCIAIGVNELAMKSISLMRMSIILYRLLKKHRTLHTH